MKKLTSSLTPEIAAITLLTIATFCLTLARFWTNQCLALTAVLVVAYRPWRQQLWSKKFIKQPVIFFALLFFIWSLISLSYSEAPNFVRAIQGLTMYSKLLFLLVLPMGVQDKRARYFIEQGLIWGIFINALLSTAYYYQMPWVLNHLGRAFILATPINATYSVNPLQMIYIVVLALWILTVRMMNRNAHFTDVLLFILLTIYLWFINIERSGYLMFLVLLLFFLYQKVGHKVFWIGLILIPIVLVGLYEFSPNVKTRIEVGITNVVDFQHTQAVEQVAGDNSLGLRLAFAQESIRVVKAHPLLGTGIGSFKYVYATMKGPNWQTLNDPHNAYTLVAFELGLIGLVLYLLWLGAIWRICKALAPQESLLLKGMWWIFVVMGITDSGLILNAVGLSFVIFISVYAQQKLLERACNSPSS